MPFLITHRRFKLIMAFKRKYFTPNEIAEFLGIKPNTLAKWRWKGIGPTFKKVGRAVRYHIDEVNNFLEYGHPAIPRPH
jgi:hypothetical protein